MWTMRSALSSNAVNSADWLLKLANNSWLKRIAAVRAMPRPVVASEVRPDRLAWVCLAVGLGLYGGLLLVLGIFARY